MAPTEFSLRTARILRRPDLIGTPQDDIPGGAAKDGRAPRGMRLKLRHYDRTLADTGSFLEDLVGAFRRQVLGGISQRNPKFPLIYPSGSKNLSQVVRD